MKAAALFKFEWNRERFCIDRVLVFCANRSGKSVCKVKPQKLKPSSILKLRRICCANRAELNRLEKLFNDLSGERFFLCLLRKQFNHFSSVFWQTHLVPCCLQELWICYDTKRVFFSPTLILLTVSALYSVYLFVCLKVKISRGKLRARIFSGGFLHLFKTSRDLCFK